MSLPLDANDIQEQLLKQPAIGARAVEAAAQLRQDATGNLVGSRQPLDILKSEGRDDNSSQTSRPIPPAVLRTRQAALHSRRPVAKVHVLRATVCAIDMLQRIVRDLRRAELQRCDARPGLPNALSAETSE